MHYLSIFDHNTNKRLAFLENAYNIGYTQEQNALWTARFTMPLSDPKNKYCRFFNFVEIWDQDKYIGLFRIIPTTTIKNEGTKEIVYECEHVLATLMDDVLLGWHEIGNRGVYTTNVLRYILDRQTVNRWQVGTCEFSHQFLYGWENENLLSALFSVPQPFTAAYIWEFNTESYPWTLSLKRAPTAVKTEIRYRKNMRGVTKTEDPTSICTRLYALGYGEGENQLNIAGVNSGKKYIDADTQAQYGVISKIWIDQRYQDEKSLFDAAVAMLEELKVPAVSYSVEALHNYELHNAAIGDFVRVIDDDLGIDLNTRIVAIDKTDIVGHSLEATITLANKSRDVASSIAEMSSRQRISEAYAQGAVTLFTTHFYDNCSPQFPAEMRFYIPDNVVHINQILLNGTAAAFRGYTKATQGGGSSSTTTGAGGGYYSSTGSGGKTTQTSSSGGSTRVTSDAVTLYSSNTVHDASDNGGTGGANHNHGIGRGTKLAITSDGKEVSGYVEWAPSGKHTHPSHSHKLEVPNHTHSITIPSHSHSVSIDAHSHNFTLPNHTHNIEYGIFSGTTAGTLTITVDGRVAGSFSRGVSDLDLVNYLSKDDSGNVQRGWHTISIKPDKLSRVEFDLVIQLFANSRGGGQY